MKKLALLPLAAPLVLAACGGGSPSAQVQADPVAYVKHAAQKTADITSEHMTMTGNVSAGSMDVKMNASGDFVNATKRGQITEDVRAAGPALRAEAVMDGADIYMKSPMFSSQLPSGKTWMKLDLQKFGASHGINYSTLGTQSPTQALQRLEAAGSVNRVGTETVNGVETTHYRVTNVDLSKMPQGAKVQALLHPKYGPIDVWIGNEDGYVHRESMSFTYSAAGRSASMSMQIDLSKFGETVNVTLPPARDVFDATDMAMSGAGG